MPTESTEFRRFNEPPCASFSDRLRNLPQYILPQRFLTRLAYRITRIRIPWFKDRLIRIFIAYFKVDMREAMEPNPSAYPDFNHFFTRSLRSGARPLAGGENVLCCPVDGVVSQAGTIEDESLLQAKGLSFSLRRLLGGEEGRALPFKGGRFITLYLSPRDYHRVHMPIRGYLREMVHIPGRLFSVSSLTARVVPSLFARNERVVAIFDTDSGPMAMVLVGAINVASIETVWAGAITPPLGKQVRCWHYPQIGLEAIMLEKGTEMGRFNMGSTVIVLVGGDMVKWDLRIQPGVKVRMGQQLAEKSSESNTQTAPDHHQS